ncbi:hypothetical protein GCM10020369_55560 [Cryptosporangium minutisporangium]|uniref:Metallo-beta-lactamase domain-containing protein n=1 Tax=Cryptosporangium minutisporangium TaxID=113569 RepID=A0ABP6T599_9ACTN
MRGATVLGGCGAFPEPGRACNGFLVQWDGYRLVLDLGYATLARLLTHCPDGAVDAVVLTHEHPDHCIDLHGLFRMHLYGDPGGRTIPLYCPPGVSTASPASNLTWTSARCSPSTNCQASTGWDHSDSPVSYCRTTYLTSASA